jgi:hypothetical protein
MKVTGKNNTSVTMTVLDRTNVRLVLDCNRDAPEMIHVLMRNIQKLDVSLLEHIVLGPVFISSLIRVPEEDCWYIVWRPLYGLYDEASVRTASGFLKSLALWLSIILFS